MLLQREGSYKLELHKCATLGKKFMISEIYLLLNLGLLVKFSQKILLFQVNKMEKTEKESTEKICTSISEENLISMEKLDRASPDLWPEQGIISDFVVKNSPKNDNSVWTSNLSVDDMSQLHYLGNLTLLELIGEVKKLHDTAYQLGLEEAKEMTRGKYLNIFKQRLSNR